MFDKTDFIRILDVVLIGPLMIYASTRARMPGTLKTILFASGIGTILYNGYNLAKFKNNLPASR